jgi:hypothetical protein
VGQNFRLASRLGFRQSEGLQFFLKPRSRNCTREIQSSMRVCSERRKPVIKIRCRGCQCRTILYLRPLLRMPSLAGCCCPGGYDATACQPPLGPCVSKRHVGARSLPLILSKAALSTARSQSPMDTAYPRCVWYAGNLISGANKQLRILIHI